GVRTAVVPRLQPDLEIHGSPPEGGHYSVLIAVIGSTRTALVAGARLPSIVISTDNATTLASVTASAGLTPASSASMLRPAAYARAIPGTTPASTSKTERRRTIDRMSLGCAPSAIRTPISCRRCDTANDRSP